jgi:hypothetical protein
MKIKIGDFDVLESGSIVGNESEPTDFILNEEHDFIVRFVFLVEDSNSDRRVKADKFGAKGIQLTFSNYNNSLGTGNAIPVRLGNYNNRELFINFRVYSLSHGGKLIHYTWLLGKGVKDGK